MSESWWAPFSSRKEVREDIAPKRETDEEPREEAIKEDEERMAQFPKDEYFWVEADTKMNGYDVGRFVFLHQTFNRAYDVKTFRFSSRNQIGYSRTPLNGRREEPFTLYGRVPIDVLGWSRYAHGLACIEKIAGNEWERVHLRRIEAGSAEESKALDHLGYPELKRSPLLPPLPPDDDRIPDDAKVTETSEKMTAEAHKMHGASVGYPAGCVTTDGTQYVWLDHLKRYVEVPKGK